MVPNDAKDKRLDSALKKLTTEARSTRRGFCGNLKPLRSLCLCGESMLFVLVAALPCDLHQSSSLDSRDSSPFPEIILVEWAQQTDQPEKG
jgi:hypothetical protein